jgi:hypothetical protein
VILAYLAVLAGTQTPAGPQAFIRRIYAGYARNNYDSLRRVDLIFSPQLAAAIRRHEHLAKGEVGYLDGDPLCGCQDHGKLTARIRALNLPSRTSAIASMHVDFGTGETSDFRLKLVLGRNGWRVADIVSSDGASLLAQLDRSNRRR